MGSLNANHYLKCLCGTRKVGQPSFKHVLVFIFGLAFALTGCSGSGDDPVKPTPTPTPTPGTDVAVASVSVIGLKLAKMAPR